MRTVIVFLIAPLVSGCTLFFPPPPEAPEDLHELNRYLFREWDDEDPLVLEAGLANLVETLEETTEGGQAEYELQPLRADDVEGIDIPEGRDPEDCYGLVVARVSAYDVDDHARLQAHPNQLPAEPTAESYTRVFLGDDPDCFPAGDCEILETENDIHRRQRPLVDVEFVLYKDFRWVPFEDDDGEERRAIVARSWIDREFEADSGPDLLQSYSVDVTIPRGDGSAWRYQTLYSEGDDTFIGVVTNSIANAVEADDEAIAELFDP